MSLPIPDSGTLKPVALIGYSGHALVAIDAFQASGRHVGAYCEPGIKERNPYGLYFLGSEQEAKVLERLLDYDYFVAIGDNYLREQLLQQLSHQHTGLISAIHPASQISPSAQIGQGSFVGPGAIVNALAGIGIGCICNSGSVIEHECEVNDFAHIGPGAVLAGRVTVGHRSLIGANATVLPGIKIGRDAVIGAGSVVTRNVADGQRVAGNPARDIRL